jgi:hypothetical protein
MSTEPLHALASFPAERANRRMPWIESGAYDLVFFILAPLLGIALVVIAPTGYGLMLFVLGALLGIPHYLSTYVFYFWDDIREYRRAEWPLFAAGPVILVVVFVALMATGFKPSLLFVLFWWNAFHITRQSCGILSIYRHAAGAFGKMQKHATNVALMAVNGCCALWLVELNPTVYPFLVAVWQPLPRVLRIGSAAVAVAALLNLGIVLWRRHAAGFRVQLPEMAALTTSLLLFLPFVWINDFNRAGFAVLSGHFLQYLGLVWLVQRRRFRAVDGSPGQRVLARISGDWRLLLTTLLAMSLFGIVLPRASRLVPWKEFYSCVAGIITFLHFYMDGLFWAFKRPEIRKAIAPYLIAKAA